MANSFEDYIKSKTGSGNSFSSYVQDKSGTPTTPAPPSLKASDALMNAENLKKQSDQKSSVLGLAKETLLGIPNTVADIVLRGIAGDYTKPADVSAIGAKNAIQTRLENTKAPKTPEERANFALSFVGEAQAVNNISKVALSEAEKYVQELVAKQKAAAEVPGGIAQKASDAITSVKKKLVDIMSPVEDVVAKTAKEGNISLLPQGDIGNNIDRVYRSNSLAGNFIETHGLADIVKNVDNIDNLEQYAIAKHNVDLASRGITIGGRELAKDMQLIEAFAPKYDTMATKLTDYSQKLLDYVTESGLISKELAAKLKETYPSYVPMNRVFNELEKGTQFFGSRGTASLSAQTIVKKLEGSSERAVMSPLESLVQKTSDAFLQGEKNQAAKVLVSYEKLPGNPFELRELKSGETAPHTISFLDNGTKRVFATTKDVADAAKGMNVQQLSILGKIMAFPVRMLKLGATGISVKFIAKNLARDQVSGFINSNESLRSSVLNPPVFLKALWTAIGHGELYDEVVRNAGMGTSFDVFRDSVPQTLASIRSKASATSRIKYLVTSPSELLRAVEDIVARSEEATRVMQYKGAKDAALARGMLPQDAEQIAAKAARENTVNFSRKGEWGQVLNNTFAYINPAIQGTRTFLRNMKAKPVATTLKVIATTLMPMAVVTNWNLSDPKRKEAYDDISEYEKENNLILVPDNPTKNPDGTWNVIKIPTSQEVSGLANMTRRGVEDAFGVDPIKAKEVADALIQTVTPLQTNALVSQITPQALKYVIEPATNKNLYTGIPIVPDNMANLPPDYQVKPTTSGTARIIGKALNASPLKVENFVGSSMATVGKNILNLSDTILASGGVIPKEQIGGESISKGVTGTFSTAVGGQKQRDEIAVIKDAMMVQDVAKKDLQLKAEAEYTRLKELAKSASPAEAGAELGKIAKENPQLAKQIVSVAQSEQLGLSATDRFLSQLDIGNGARAKFIWKIMSAMETDQEKVVYLDSLVKKKLVSPAVLAQLGYLKSHPEKAK